MQGVQLKILANTGEHIRRKFDISAIEQSVQGNTVSVTGSNARIMFSQKIAKQLRFLDMKKFGNAHVYNRPVWATVYGDIANELMYVFSEDIKAGIRQELENAVKPLDN
jgi:hypothetical protein